MGFVGLVEAYTSHYFHHDVWSGHHEVLYVYTISWLFVCAFLWIITHVNSFQRDQKHWRHNGRDGVSNHQPHDCLLNRLFRLRSRKTPKLRITGFCARNSPVNSPHKWPVTRKMFPFNVVIMNIFFFTYFIKFILWYNISRHRRAKCANRSEYLTSNQAYNI